MAHHPECCPPNSFGEASAALAGETRPFRGHVVTLSVPNGAETVIYLTKPAAGQAIKGGVLLFHDIYGCVSAEAPARALVKIKRR